MPVPSETKARYTKGNVIHGKIEPLGRAELYHLECERTRAPPSDQPSQKTADRRQHHTFDQQLPDDAPAARTDRQADGDLTRPASCPRQHQVGDVDAGDEQHEAHSHQHRGKDHDDFRTHVELVVVLNHRRIFPVRDRVGGRQVVTDAIHLGAGSLDVGPVLHAPEHDHESALALFEGVVVAHGHELNPQILVERKPEIFGHHADHGCRIAVKPYGAAEDGGIFAVAPLPQPVGQKQHRGCAAAFIGVREIAADDRFLTDQAEGVGTDSGDLVAFRGRRLVANGGAHTDRRGQALKGMDAGPPVSKIGKRNGAEPLLLAGSVALAQVQNAVAPIEGEALEKNGT